MRFLRSYLSGALSDLKAGTLEKPHHLHLKRLLGWRPRDARNRVLLARHACARGLLGSQTLRVARATTARPRPRCSRGERGAGRRAGRSAKARPFLNFAPVAVEPAERLERTHRQSPPGTSFREKERGVHVPSASVRFAAAQNLLWEPPPGEPPTAPASGIPLGSPRVLQRGCCLGRVHLGAAAFRGAREPGGHLYAVPREDRRPPVSPAAAVALEAEPSRAAQRPRHEAQLHPATEGL